jgi:hypothetical protein
MNCSATVSLASAQNFATIRIGLGHSPPKIESHLLQLKENSKCWMICQNAARKTRAELTFTNLTKSDTGHTNWAAPSGS